MQPGMVGGIEWRSQSLRRRDRQRRAAHSCDNPCSTAGEQRLSSRHSAPSGRRRKDQSKRDDSRSRSRTGKVSACRYPSEADLDVTVCSAITGDVVAELLLPGGSTTTHLRRAVRAAAGTPRHVGLRFQRGNKDLSESGAVGNGWRIDLIIAPLQFLLTGSADRSAAIWDSRSGEWCGSLLGHRQNVLAVAYSPDGSCIATGSADCTTKLWNGSTSHLRLTLRGHHGAVFCAAFSPDGLMLCTGSRDRTARIWSTGNFGDCLCVLRGHTDVVSSVCFSPDGARVATASEDTSVMLWEATTGLRQCQILISKCSVNGVAFPPEGKMIAMACRDGKVRICSIDGTSCTSLTGHTKRVYSVAYAPDGSCLASASADGTVRLWSCDFGQQWSVLRGHSGAVYAVAFSPDSAQVVTGGQDGLAMLWDVSTASCVRTFRGHEGSVLCVAVACALESTAAEDVEKASEDRGSRCTVKAT